MRFIIFTLLLFLPSSYAKEHLIFGAIAVENPDIIEKKFQPLLNHLEKELNATITFASAPTYDRTIHNFITSEYDFGWMGPSPLIKALERSPHSLRTMVSIERPDHKKFKGVIITRQDSTINKIGDLQGKRFAFGSPNSTLSHYIPKYLLLKANVLDTLTSVHFLGRHDKVVKDVIMGKSDAGGVKYSVAQKYKQFVKVIAQSETLPNFTIVCTNKCSSSLEKKLTDLLLAIDDPSILNPIFHGAKKFIPRSLEDYHELKKIMYRVDHHTTW
jgi:phosphonate transport system substrate-binding protein